MANILKKDSGQYHKRGLLKIAYLVVAIVAVVLLVSAFALSPSTDTKASKVSGIEFEQGVISINPDLSKVFVKINYSNGTFIEVAMSELKVVGLDPTKEGLQNVSFNFGGFEQTISINIVTTDCVIQYKAPTGGRIEGDTIQRVPAGGSATTVMALPEVGYEFVSWNDGEISPTRTDKKISVDREIVATFKRISYTVIFFYPDGTNARPQQVFYNEAAIEVPRPDNPNMLKEGYEFVGWSESYDHITADTNIKAIMRKHATDVHMDITKGIDGKALGTIENLRPYYPKEKTSSIQITPNPERIFSGWEILNYQGEWISLQGDDGQVSVPIGSAITNVSFRSTKVAFDEVYNLTFDLSKDAPGEMSVRAKFVYKISDISFISFGNKIGDSVPLEYGTSIGENLKNPPEVFGFEFKYWYKKGSLPNADGSYPPVSKDAIFDRPTDLIAFWERKLMNVEFLSNESSFPGSTVKVLYQDSLENAKEGIFPTDIPSKPNFTFKGWFICDSDGILLSPMQVFDKTYKITSNMKISPYFEVIKHDLSIAIKGSGKATFADGTTIPAGINKLEQNKNYTIKFMPSVGYKVASFKINGAITTLTPIADSAETNISLPTTAYEIEITFITASYNMNVINGNGNEGQITYSSYVNDVLEEGLVSVDKSIDAVIKYKDIKRLTINALTGYYIKSIQVDGRAITNIPNQATDYNLVTGEINGNVNVIIVYEKLIFDVVITVGSFGGTVTPDKSISGGFEINSEVSFIVAAERGRYIRNFYINGVSIDPYNYDNTKYEITKIFINDYSPTASDSSNSQNQEMLEQRDVRLTYFIVKVLEIKNSIAVSIKTDPIFYNLSLSVNGIGTVSVGGVEVKNKMLTYGEAVQINASTLKGYYIASRTVNKQSFGYPEKPQSAVFDIKDCAQDFAIEFTFTKMAESVVINGANAFVAHNNDAAIALPTTIGKIESGSNNIFVITAKEGYFIKQLLVAGKKEPLAYNATSHTITINNLANSITIEVETELISLNAGIILLNAGSTAVNGTSSAKFNYGTNINFSFDLANGDAYTIIKGQPSSIDVVGNVVIFNYIDVKSSFEVIVEITRNNPEGDRNLVILPIGKGTVTSDFNANDAIDTMVKFVITPDQYYKVKHFVVNGKIIPNITTTYSMAIENRVVVEVVFEETAYNIRLENNNISYGQITANLTAFTYAQMSAKEVTLTFVVNTGYKIKNISIAQEGSGLSYIDNAIINQLNNATEKVLALDNRNYNVHVTVTFEAVALTYNVESTGFGDVLDANKTTEPPVVENTDHTINYGSELNLRVVSNTSNFVNKIFINNVEVPVDSLTNPVRDSSINKIISGILKIRMTESINIRIEFKANVYTASIVKTISGTTLVGNEHYDQNDGNGMELGAGSKINIYMTANNGYHIKSLMINGKMVPGSGEDDWRLDKDNENNNRKIIYEYIVEQNITIRVEYAQNMYSAFVSEVNNSANFQSYDTETSRYGYLRIFGYDRVDNKYIGIPHGESLRVTATPITSRGYYIADITMTYFDPDSESTNNTIRVSFKNNVSENGGTFVIPNVKYDIQSIEVLFLKRTYSYNASIVVDTKNSDFVSDGKFDVTFYNPYDKNAPVSLLNGKYEHGLEYEIISTPGTGYTRTETTLNEISVNSNFIVNRIYTTVTGDMNYITTYTIQEFNVSVNSPSESGGRIQIQDMFNTTITLTNNTIRVTYNTRLYFVATPNYLTAGYYIESMTINGNWENIIDRNNQYGKGVTITNDTHCDVSFAINRYIFNIGGTGNGNSLVHEDYVVWGNSTTISLILQPGYILKSITINAVPLSNIELANFISSGSLTLYGIKSNVNLNLVFDPREYTLTFNNFTVSAGAVYLIDKDSRQILAENNLKLYYSEAYSVKFVPKEGFRLTSVTVSMNNLDGISSTLVNSPGQLSTDKLQKDVMLMTALGITGITGHVSMTVEFKIKSFSYSQSILGDGSISVNGLENNRVSYDNSLGFTLISGIGYHLESIRINGLVYNPTYVINAQSQYEYTISNIKVDNAFLNEMENIHLEAIFVKNVYRVVAVINGQTVISGGFDNTLRVVHNDEITADAEDWSILQYITKGYSITSLTLGWSVNSEPIVSFNGGDLIAENLKILFLSKIYLELDYHSDAKNVLYIRYTTEINKYVNTINKEVVMAVNDPEYINVMNNYISQKINASTDPLSGNRYEHGTTFNIVSAIVSGQNFVRFEGYQELIDGKWAYVKNGVNGITLGLDGKQISYVLEKERTFRAVYFRIFEYNVKVFPEFKHLSGNEVANWVLKKYGKLNIFAKYDGAVKPNSATEIISLGSFSNKDGVNTMTFKVDYSAKIYFTFEDTESQNRSASVKYSYVSRSGNLLNFTNIPNLASLTGEMADANREIYAFFQNIIKYNITQTTIGGSSAEGGTVALYNETSSRLLQRDTYGNISLASSDVLRLTITPNSNHKFVGLEKRIVQGTDASGNLIFSNDWETVRGTGDGMVTESGDGTKVFTVKVVENAVYRVVFTKIYTVSTTVEYMIDDSTPILGEAPKLSTRPEDKVYQYNDQLYFAVNNSENQNGIKWQFMGYFVNGVNYHKNLLNFYPSVDRTVIPLHQYDPSNGINDGVDLKSSYNIKIVAKFMPILNVTISNNYQFVDNKGVTHYFNPGSVVYTALKFDSSYAKNYVETFVLGAGTETVKSSVAFATIPKSPKSDDKDKFNNMTLKLEARVLEGFAFNGWYAVVDGQNKALRLNANRVVSGSDNLSMFTFYMDGLYDQLNTVYPFMSEDAKIEIVPQFKKKERITVNTVEYFVDETTESTADAINQPSISVANGSFQTEKSIETDYDAEVFVRNNVRAGYEFLGYFYRFDGINYERITESKTLNEFFTIVKDGQRETGLTMRMDRTVEIQVRFIKNWEINVTVFNDTSSYYATRLPYITTPDSSGSYQSTNASRYIVTLRAGQEFKFGLARNSSFNFAYDKYISTTVISKDAQGGTNDSAWESEDILTSIIPDNSSGVGLEVARYAITATGTKTVTVTFRSHVDIRYVDNYTGSGIKLPSVLSEKMGLKDEIVYDGGENDGDNVANGTILLKGVPVFRNVNYSGTMGVKFTNIQGPVEYRAANGTLVSIPHNLEGLQEISISILNAYGLSGGMFSGSTGNGSAENPYQIANAAQLLNLDNVYVSNTNSLSGLHFELINDIVMPATWKPIARVVDAGGNATSGFDGTLNGKNFNLDNFSIAASGAYFGLFGAVYGGTVKNLNFRFSARKSVSFTDYGGLLAGAILSNSIIDNVKIICNERLTITGGNFIGALTGRIGPTGGTSKLTNITINNVTIAASGSYAGGVAGIMQGGSMTDATVRDISITGNAMGYGGLLGFVSTNADTVAVANSLIQNITISGQTAYMVGGAIGIVVGRNTKIENISSVGIHTLTVSNNKNLQTDTTTHGTSKNESGALVVANNSFGRYTAGGLFGYNEGAIILSNNTASTHNMVGGSIGGIVGINAGTISGGNITTSTKTYVTQSEVIGGIYGGFAAFNLGTISGVTINNNSSNGLVYGSNFIFVSTLKASDVINLYDNRYDGGGGGPFIPVATATNATLTVGVFVGSNQAGSIISNKITATAVVNRITGDNTASITNAAGIAGVMGGTGIVIKDNVVSATVFQYAYADATHGGGSNQILEQRFGSVSTSTPGSISGNTGSVNWQLYRRAASNSSELSTSRKYNFPWWYDFTSGYYEVRMRATTNTAGLVVSGGIADGGLTWGFDGFKNYKGATRRIVSA